jgi:hypothetical protein
MSKLTRTQRSVLQVGLWEGFLPGAMHFPAPAKKVTTTSVVCGRRIPEACPKKTTGSAETKWR